MRAVGHNSITLWVGGDVLDACVADASSAYPLETGGTFMGWWADPRTAVIATMIGGGPSADRGRNWFEPDQDWQLERIAERYQASGRRETYLGDWHSHPGATSGALSCVDRAVLRRVMGSSGARCARPLMLVLFGGASRWDVVAWCAYRRRGAFLSRCLVVRPVSLRPYHPNVLPEAGDEAAAVD